MIDPTIPPHVGQRTSPGTRSAQRNRARASAGSLVVCILLAVVAVYVATSIHSQNVALADAKAQLDQADAKAEKAQASLATVNSQATTLQVQLNGNQDLRTTLQQQLEKAKAQAADAEADLAKDRSLRADLQSQLDQAKAQAARAGQESAAIRAQLDQARSQAADAQAQLAKARGDLTRVHPLIVESRHLPLTTAFEKSFWDQGFMLHITNSANAALNVKITVSGTDKTRAEMAVIEGGATLNVGSLPAGEHVDLASEGFDPINLIAR